MSSSVSHCISITVAGKTKIPGSEGKTSERLYLTYHIQARFSKKTYSSVGRCEGRCNASLCCVKTKQRAACASPPESAETVRFQSSTIWLCFYSLWTSKANKSSQAIPHTGDLKPLKEKRKWNHSASCSCAVLNGFPFVSFPWIP